MSQHAKDLFLSAVLDRPVISRSGREVGRLFDVAMSPGDPLPVVHHVLVKSARATRRVAFNDLAMFNDVVVSLKGEPEALPDLPESESEVLMRRDILDKQIVDVDGARVVRVNDLKLALASGGLCLSAVDVGFRGILRRLGYLNAWDFLGGVLKRKLAPKEIDWLLVQPLDANLSQLTLTVTRQVVNTYQQSTGGFCLLQDTREEDLSTPFTQIFTIGARNMAPDDTYPSITFDSVPYWQFSTDPASYGSETFSE